MSLCVVAGATVLRLAAASFTLEWTHSVERAVWRETWRVGRPGLALVEARVKGSGAGMEPGPDARLVEGWWTWAPASGAIARLRLAASEAAPEGWRLCAIETCVTLGAPGTPFASGAELMPCD